MSSDDLQAVNTLRCTGQYSAALLALSTYDSKHAKHITEQYLILQRAQCHFALYQFAELFRDVEEFRKQPNCEGTKEEALINLLEAHWGVHTNLKLQEAVVIADGIYSKWIEQRNVQDFDELDISLLCLHHMLKDLEQRLLSDTPESAEIKTLQRKKMDSLRELLLQDCQIDLLALLHTAQATTQPSEVQIPQLRQTIRLLNEDAGPMRMHLVILLAQALHENGDFELAWSELAAIEAPQMPISGSERSIWAECLRLKGVSGSEGISVAENLCGRFEDQGNRRGVLLCHVHAAKIFISMNNTQRYRLEVEAMLRDIKTYSALEFWLHYIQHFFKEDMNDRKRLGIAISFCTQFFTLHKECSIPELEYMLAASLADCYEELGDMHHALHWRLSGKEFADETDDQSIRDEAEYQVQTTLAGASIIAADDPHGVKQPEWERAQKADLEVKYWDSKAQEKHKYQYAYAFDLFQKELGDEIKLKKYPCGQIWLSRVNEALDLIPENRYEERSRIAFTLGHSKFVFGDFDGALETLTDAFQQATTAGNDKYGIARIALFTKSRVYLHQYLSTMSIESFEACRATLQESQARSEERGKIDEIACCHVVGAVLWHAKGISHPAALNTALHHISEAERLWSEEREALFTELGLDSLTSKYSLRGRNESNQYSILGLAIEICFQLEDLPEAWTWIEYAKARAFLDDLDPERTALPRADNFPNTDSKSRHPLPNFVETALAVHWVFVGETIYMMTRRGETEFRKFKLDITVSTVKEWYQGIMSTREDYRDPDTALDLLSELVELCRPLSDPEFVGMDELLILCPTQILFKIPLHAIPVDNCITLLDRNPIMYTHSFGVLQRCLHRGSQKCSDIPGPHFFGNPTEDTPAGEKSVLALERQYGGEVFVRDKTTKATFLSKSPASKFVHFHGHVISALHPLNNAMLFHGGEELKVREVFEMNLHLFNPFISLIGCGSGTERFEVGDEPLGFISSFLYAGASTVLATLWPINDELSGAAFSNVFYGLGVTHTFNPKEVVDLSKRLRIAALSIKARQETAAPYFWAAFVMHGNWRVALN